MPFGKQKDRAYLDGRHCFEVYAMYGSWRKAAIALGKEGVRNPARRRMDTPSTPTGMGVQAAAKNWAVRHPEEARSILAAYNLDGFYDRSLQDDEYYYETLVEYARQILKPDEFEDLMTSEPYVSYVQA